jgi:hypothetical protein
MVYISLTINNINKSLISTKGLNYDVNFMRSKGSYGLIKNMDLIDCLNILELNNFKLISQNRENGVTSYILHCPSNFSVSNKNNIPNNKYMERELELENAPWP